MLSLLDRTYARIANRRTFFSGGWGNIPLLLWMRDRPWRESLLALTPDTFSLSTVNTRTQSDCVILDVCFESPFRIRWSNQNGDHVSEMPPEARQGHAQFVLPRDHTPEQPIVILFPATGEEGFQRRRNWTSLPLAEHGVASLILEAPFYGRRRPPGARTSPGTVSDFLIMCLAMQVEGLALMRHLRERRYKRIGLAGVSMGGYMALATAALDQGSCSVAALVPSHGAAPVYTEGLLSRYVDWSALTADAHHLAGPVDDDRATAWLALRRVLELSDLRRLPPFAHGRAAVLAARSDAYIPAYSSLIMKRHWPQANFSWRRGGHVAAFVTGRGAYRDMIAGVLGL
ncbi:MAG: alpha/beta fold hydrolase [Spirochaetales bacterium]|nr:alpha/beta fold hydrolase [Spirochaetales bacterium]